MKHSADEQYMIDLLRAAGGSTCPGEGFVPGFKARRLLRRLARNGVITIEQTDDGCRYSLAEGANG